MPLWSHDKWQGGCSDEILLLQVKRPHLRSNTATFTAVGKHNETSVLRVSTDIGGGASRIKKISPKQWLQWPMCGASDKDQIFILAEIKSFLPLNLLWILQKICPRIYLADQPTHWARTVLWHCCCWKAAGLKVFSPYLKLFSIRD